MKKAIIIMIALFILFDVKGFVFGNEYTKEMIVTSVDDTLVTITDNQGNLFQFDEDGFLNGEKLTVKFYDSKTAWTITDDRIVGVKRDESGKDC